MKTTGKIATKPKRHHHIPQLLLRGFATERKGNFYTCWFPKGGTPKENINIINVAVVHNFHKGAQWDLEEEMSVRESQFALALDDLRQTGVADQNTASTVAQFVFNMMVRTNNLRNNMSDGVPARSQPV